MVDDSERPTASVISRTAHGLFEQSIQQVSVQHLITIAAGLGIDHFALHTVDSGGPTASELLDTAAALRHTRSTRTACPCFRCRGVSERLALGEGLWHGPDGASRLSTTRTVDYSVHRPSHGVFDERDATLADVVQGKHILLVLDANVDALYGASLHRYAQQRLNVRGVVTITPREADKTWSEVERVCQAAMTAGLDRRGVIVAVGGGVTLDIAGLAAALYRRGVGYVRVSTTLVALIDVSLGVKHAVNAWGRKSLIGSFYPPTACINDYGFLRTLPRADMARGIAEIVKIALVRDSGLFRELEAMGSSLLDSSPPRHAARSRDIWFRAECLMLEELGTNLFEEELARLADFGHTFSPSLESDSNYRIGHGEAVALDMLLSTAIGVRQGVCALALFERLADLLEVVGLPTWDPILQPIVQLRAALHFALQHRGGSLNLVVPVMAGRATFVQAVTDDDLTFAAELMHSRSAQMASAANGTRNGTT